ncbi:myosin regulatory light chain 1 [Fusarium pseudocircinatum]|uniref:Myosin regulatory light chain 1 n=2 Tax=Fusarium fujikuroi species complex TaxID=171627 RepID=A0A8H5KI27_9HYPO|nr:myosin regulatory light chain 1 [Fusarium pseudocircinatum]
MSVPVTYKPSHLGYGSSPTRSSPFRRAESPASPSPLRHTTPTGSPTKAGPFGSTSRFARPSTPTSTQPSWTPKAKTPVRDEMNSSPSRMSPVAVAPRTPVSKSLGNGNALSQLQATQVRTLRDAFQIMDRDCDGVVNREDVTDMLNQLGLPSNPADVSKFFPPSAPQTITLAVFLNSLADALAALSPSAELLSAFSAFDDDDSGQVDLVELRKALLDTAPEPGEKALTASEVDKIMNGFTGRRAFNRNMNAHLGAKRGEVFKYQEFVGSIMGSNNGSDNQSHDNEDDEVFV